MTPKQILSAIKKYNMHVQPSLVKKLEGCREFWAAGPTQISPSGYSNFIPYAALCWGKTLEEAVEKAVLKIERNSQ